LDASGNGQVRIGPSRPGEQWNILGIGVIVSSAAIVPSTKLYRGNVGQASFISATKRGDADSNDDPKIPTLNAGEFITLRWEGGDAGATATATFRIERLDRNGMG
jgi:hypothetical protein